MANNDVRTVAVVDAVPTYKLGLEAALAAAQLNVANPTNTRAWARTMREAAVVVTLRSAQDEELLHDLHVDRPERPLVAILTAVHSVSFRQALVMGAHAAVAWNCSPEEIVGVVRAALRGRALLPTDVVRSIALDNNSEPPFSNAEKGWLDQLAQGIRVTQLARQTGYSEREMHRLLQRLYGRLGAASRSEALVKATRMGLLTP